MLFRALLNKNTIIAITIAMPKIRKPTFLFFIAQKTKGGL
jgi:hypothetical protein